MIRTLTFLLLLCLTVKAVAQINVTNYGASGDAVQFYCNTVSNSVVVTTVNTNATVGMCIEVWGVGKQTIGNNSYGIYVTNYLDAIGYITNIVNSTNLYVSFLPQQTTTNTFATMGTDNTPAFIAAIAASAVPTQTINIPSGTFFLRTTNHSYAGDGYSAVSLPFNRGGLTFNGGTNTVLLSKGAITFETYPGGTEFVRGFMFQTVSPITNNLPIIFQNLTLDGGVTNANRIYNLLNVSVNQVDGYGWDQHYSAFVNYDLGNKTLGPISTTFSNCIVQHWQGEMLKSIDQNTNKNFYVFNCSFVDGQATAWNQDGGGIRSGNTVLNVRQIAEDRMALYTNSVYTINNLFSNITANAWAWDNDSPTQPASWFSNNICSFTNGNGLQIVAGVNVHIVNNTIDFSGATTGFLISDSGGVGNTTMNSNIWISGNTITCSSVHLNIFQYGGSATTNNGVVNLYISNNVATISTIQNIIYQYGGVASNVVFANNQFNCTYSAVDTYNGTPQTLVQTNNYYTPYGQNGSPTTTNAFYYGGNHLGSGGGYGGWRLLCHSASSGNNNGSTFTLDDSQAAQIPAGAQIIVDNLGGSGAMTLIPSDTVAKTPIAIAANTATLFNWTGSYWTNGVYTPPVATTTIYYPVRMY